MIVIGHLAPSMACPIEPFTNVTENFQLYVPISLAEENVLATITARGYMIETARQFYSSRRLEKLRKILSYDMLISWK